MTAKYQIIFSLTVFCKKSNYTTDVPITLSGGDIGTSRLEMDGVYRKSVACNSNWHVMAGNFIGFAALLKLSLAGL
jgi:hypothetical protein